MEIYSQFQLLPLHRAKVRMVEKTNYYREQEAQNPGYWEMYNSPLWPDPKDSSDETRSYDGSLRSVLPDEETSLLSYMEYLKAAKIARTQNPNVSFTGVVLFGQGSRLFADFPRGLFTSTGANSLTDMREPEERTQDEAIHHTFVPGSYYEEHIRQQVYDAVGGKADVTILRAYRGDGAFPLNPFLTFQELQLIWNHTEIEGVILAQIGHEMWPLVRPFVDRLNETETIEAEVGYTPYVGDFLRLVRHQDAPDQLPHLRRQEIRQSLRRAIGTGRPFPL